MKLSRTLFILCILAGLFAAIQSGVGLLYHPAGDPFTVTSIHGEEVELYGRGIYAYDSYFKGPINRGTDAVTLFLAVPMLAVSLYYAKKGTICGRLFLTAVLAYLLYIAASVSMGVAYNNLFLVYTVQFATALFAFILAFSGIDVADLARRTSEKLPRKGIAALLFFAGAGVTFAWLPDLLSALAENRIPFIQTYTTGLTDVLDLGIIAPSAFLAGILFLRRKPLGTLLAATLMIVLAIVAVTVTSQTVFQTLAGLTFPIPVYVFKVGSFVVLGAFAVGLIVRLVQSIAEGPAEAPSSKGRKVARAARA